MLIGNVEMREIRPNFWVPRDTVVIVSGDYVEYRLDGKMILAEPNP